MGNADEEGLAKAKSLLDMDRIIDKYKADRNSEDDHRGLLAATQLTREQIRSAAKQSTKRTAKLTLEDNKLLELRTTNYVTLRINPHEGRGLPRQFNSVIGEILWTSRWSRILSSYVCTLNRSVVQWPAGFKIRPPELQSCFRPECRTFSEMVSGTTSSSQGYLLYSVKCLAVSA